MHIAESFVHMNYAARVSSNLSASVLSIHQHEFKTDDDLENWCQ